MIGQKINQLFDSLEAQPELSCRALISEIRRCFNWHNHTWEKLKSALSAEGLLIEKVLASIPQQASPIAEYLLIEQLATEILPPLLVAEIGRRKLAEYETQFNEVIKHLITFDQRASTEQDSSSQGCIGRIIQAVHAKDTQAYAEALNYTRRIKAIRPQAIERNTLLKKLKLVAPNWAKQIFYRQSPHHQANIPGDVTMAWTWRQLHEELIRRDQLDADALQKKITATQAELRQITESLIDVKAWGKQLERLQQDNSMRQALVGWLDTMKRLISTHRADRRQALLSESRRLMKKCSGAVPVWVMPIALVAENFDPRTTHFDVVIIDEASQANLNALVPLYMGKKIIVVGDHEQVTPLGIGEEQTSLDHLRSAMLQDIPNSHLFDHQSSIYDIGRQSFGDAIRLVEHFRCVPEIIAFSNKLSYEGSIRPLRESNSTHLKPACVPYQVKGVRDGDINLIEAEQIVALIKAMTQHPAYTGKSIGIISMLKENQAKLIQSLIHKNIDSLEIEQRRIQSGIPGTFQGDERDIIFLSMVDSPAEQGTLRAVHEGAFESNKKRYNVAASRARDQLWVIHSFDPELHLKTSDIRFNLLQHMKDPLASIRLFDQEATKTESPFEREVLKRLTDAGFQVKTQWQVGYYRIDMVVEGNGKRLAVECDGDRYHPLEKLAEDMERQAVLERLGWQFARIRGSAFYRNPTTTMKIIFDRLVELEIQPQIQTADKAPIADMSLVHELEKLSPFKN